MEKTMKSLFKATVLFIVALVLVSCNGPKTVRSAQMNREGIIEDTVSDSTGVDEFESSKYWYYLTWPKNIKMALKDTDGNGISTFGNLKSIVENQGQTLSFAMNGGMYSPNYDPIGLYIQDGKKIRDIAVIYGGSGNFNLGFGSENTNGVLLIDKNGKASIIKSVGFTNNGETLYATQSGPLLIYDGSINPNFSNPSPNTLLRNGVGVMSDGRVVMIMAENISFYNLSRIFIEQFGCKNALYLDGVISDMYISKFEANMMNRGGGFGVMIYVCYETK